MPQGYQVTARSGLNLRSGPGPDYEILDLLTPGQVIEAPDSPEPENGFVPVALGENGEDIGWASKDWLEPVELAGPEGEEPEADGTIAPELLQTAYDFSTKAGAVAAIIKECQFQGLIPAQTAHILATVEIETGNTFQCVREAFYISKDFATAEAWRQKHLQYYRYYGRGFPQLTWEENYRKYSANLTNRFGVEIDLVVNPDLALNPDYSLFILVDGIKNGVFTGRKISQYINNKAIDFYNARHCVNGLDKAQKIADLAQDYLEQLTSAPQPAVVEKPQEFPWYAWLKSKVGIKEVPGEGDNPEIVSWFKLIKGFPEDKMHDETAWCGAAMNAAMILNGFPGVNSAWAADWLQWGRAIDEPVAGCVMLIRRDGGSGYHVTCFHKEESGRVFGIGGNQSNSIRETSYDAGLVPNGGYRLPLEMRL